MEFEVQPDFGLVPNGDLVRLAEGQLYCGDAAIRYSSLDAMTPATSTDYWAECCSGMDALGGLIMLAASLVAYDNQP